MPELSDNDVIKTLNSHSSVRSFKSDPVPDHFEKAILSSAIQASTSSNLQSYSIIRVTDPESKIRLSELAGGQNHVAECPLLFLFCADIFRLRKVTEITGFTIQDEFLELFLVASIDAALACQNALVAAESLGLGGVMIGGMRNNPREAAKHLQLPDGVYVVMGLCIGYPKEKPPVKQRLPLNVLCHEQKYSTENLENELKKYSKAMSESGLYDGRQLSDDKEYGWLHHTSRRLASKKPYVRRDHLRKELENMGFGLK